MYDKEKGKGDEGEIHKTEMGEYHPSHATVPYPCLWMTLKVGADDKPYPKSRVAVLGMIH